MRRFINLFSIPLLATVLFTSCSDDGDNGAPKGGVPSSLGCYIVNQGGMSENDGSIQFYDYSTGEATAPDAEGNIFVQQNGEMLGDIAQDLMWVDDKLFVTLSGSQKIEVLDESGKRIRAPHKFEVEGASPRMMATDGTRVYVTNYDGNVYVYSAATGDLVRTIPVGVRPEGICICDGFLVVNNAGDLYAYNGSISIIDIENGDTKNISMCNPYTMNVVCDDKVYIIDSGNYADIPSNVYSVSPREGTAVSLNISASAIAAYEGKLYYVNTSYLEDWTPVYSPLMALDIATGETQELLSADKMKNIYSLSVNPENGDIFAGYAEYGVLGTMRVFAQDGRQKGVFTVGYYTGGARFEN